MITQHKARTRRNEPQAYSGLSTDIKPKIGVMNGSRFEEMDTGKVFKFDADLDDWRLWTAASSSGGGGGDGDDAADIASEADIQGIKDSIYAD